MWRWGVALPEYKPMPLVVPNFEAPDPQFGSARGKGQESWQDNVSLLTTHLSPLTVTELIEYSLYIVHAQMDVGTQGFISGV